MKKILVAIAAMALSMPSFAQFSSGGFSLDEENVYYGVRIGLTAANLSGDNVVVKNLGGKVGMTLAGVIGLRVSNTAPVFLESGLYYTERGAKKDKFKTVLEKNRALQLAIYKAMLMNHENHSQSIRTAYFVMPYGKLFSTDSFYGENCELITPKLQSDIMAQLRNGYAERVKEISEGVIETADNQPIHELTYAQAGNVYPLDAEGVREPKKAENLYSDYKCFTI